MNEPHEHRMWFEPASREVNDDLYAKAHAGDKQAASDLVCRNVGLVIYKVEQYLAFYPKLVHLRDDMQAAGYLGLCEAVNKMISEPEHIESNPTGFLSIHIQKAIGETIETEETIRIPHESKRREKLSPVPTVGADKLPEEAFSYDPDHMEWLRETLDACCEHDLDREILRLREEGYVDREIADLHGIPVTTIFVMRQTIYARFLEMTGWPKTPKPRRQHQ